MHQNTIAVYIQLFMTNGMTQEDDDDDDDLTNANNNEDNENDNDDDDKNKIYNVTPNTPLIRISVHCLIIF